MFVWNDPNDETRLPQIMVCVTEYRQFAVDVVNDEDPVKIRDAILDSVGVDCGNIFVFSDAQILTKERG